MVARPQYTDNDGISVFTPESFFRPGCRVYIQRSTDFPEYVGVVHKHEFIEIVWVISGRAEHSTPTGSYPVVKGDLVIVDCGTAHVFHEDAQHPEPFIAYDLMFTPDCVDSLLFDLESFRDLCTSFVFYSIYPEKRMLGPDLHLSGGNYSVFSGIFQKIYREFMSETPGYEALIRAYVVELIVRVLRILNDMPEKTLSNRKKQAVEDAISYMAKHFGRNVTLDELARETFFSKDYFARMFHDVTGMRVHTYLQNLRIEEACHLLRTTDMKISDIAAACGFNDLSFFYSVFRKKTNQTPGKYRKSFD